jgi:hypothetical protein
MDMCHCAVNHAGSRDMQVFKSDVTPAEIMILRALHGDDAVHRIRVTGSAKRGSRAEHVRLVRIYGGKAVAETFPGSAPRLPDTLAEAGLRETNYRDPDPEPSEPDLEDEEDEAPAAPPAAAAAVERVLASKAKAAALT